MSYSWFYENSGMYPSGEWRCKKRQTKKWKKCYASYTRARRMVREPNVRMCEWDCELCCTIPKQFAYRSPQMEICRFFAQTQRELDAPGVLCSPQICGKLINHAPNRHRMRMEQCISRALVYTRF